MESNQPIDHGIGLPLPDGIAQMRAVNLDNLYAIVSVDGFAARIFQRGVVQSTNYNIDRGKMLNATIEWFERIPGTSDLALARRTISRPITSSISIVTEQDDYVTEGEGFDADNDGFWNLAERIAGTNPSLAETADVRINSFDPDLVDAPLIDGLYESVYGDVPAQFNDINNQRLSITNLMVDQGARRPDGGAEFRWFAMHDTTYLYLFVLGEQVSIATPIRDSAEVWQDDSIDIFIDGNNSKGTVYDKVDDRHIMIPLLTNRGDTSGQNTTYFEPGPNTAALPFFEFATCLCRSGQNTWEVKLPLAEFGIVVGRPFGIDVQLNEDNDGGTRDAKWAWFHPSRATSDTDNTYLDPSYMGTAVLQIGTDSTQVPPLQ